MACQSVADSSSRLKTVGGKEHCCHPASAKIEGNNTQYLRSLDSTHIPDIMERRILGEFDIECKGQT